MNLINHIPEELLLTVDAMNTLNGGTAQEKIRVNEDEESFRVAIKVPRADRDSFKVYINDNLITAIHLLAFDTLKKPVLVPRPVWNYKLPIGADIDEITSRFEDGWLYIDVPLTGYNTGISREVAID